MAHFAWVNLVIGKDLNISLHALVTVMEKACMSLHKEIRTALGPTMYKMCGDGVELAINKYHQKIDSAITQALLFLDCAHREACSFLKKQVSAMKSSEELQELTTTLTE